jgi:hypothetical protein
MNNKQIAELLKDALLNGDSDSIHFAIGELENSDYNGWSNRETWATALWINNDHGLYELASENICQLFLENMDIDDRENGYMDGLIAAEDWLKDWVEDLFSFDYWADMGGMTRDIYSMISDIGSLYRVNFREIAENWLDDEIAEFKAGKYEEINA